MVEGASLGRALFFESLRVPQGLKPASFARSAARLKAAPFPKRWLCGERESRFLRPSHSLGGRNDKREGVRSGSE
jgi:hypothetical protein